MQTVKLGDVTYFDEFSKLGRNLLLNLENASQIKLFCYKNVFLRSINNVVAPCPWNYCNIKLTYQSHILHIF